MRVVRKIVKLEKSILSWNEPFGVGKLKMNLETSALSCKVKLEKTVYIVKEKSWKASNKVGKIGS